MSCEDENRGTVKVINNRYKPSGHFHYGSPNTPILNEMGKLLGVTNPRDITHIHSYGGEAIFFESLSKGKLLATRCDNPLCESHLSIYEPFRIHCPDCLVKATVLDITDLAKRTATVHSFMITERTGAFNTLEVPIKFVNVEFDGVCTILMGYLSLGNPKIGMKLLPIFNTKAPTYTILDISWVPAGTPESELPQNFTF
ncbi:MAG: hypothetical protein QF682_09805 [Candidatus Thermoplasmatota archaeon]|jgi:hypothetical protein|nr:hypothetical protein [Candidatus Thermoplasmatota archaeon]